MTELDDHLKLLFARASRLFCGNCGREVRRDTPETIADQLPPGRRLMLTFPVRVPDNFSEEEVRDLLGRQGYTRFRGKEGKTLEVVQDRITFSAENRPRLIEDLEAALKYGQGRLSAYPLEKEGEGEPMRFSSDLHCAHCDIHYRDPVPNLFSFNSPIGACDACRGFGRTIGIDWSLVVPDDTKSLAGGAVKPWQTESFREVKSDLLKFSRVKACASTCRGGSSRRRSAYGSSKGKATGTTESGTAQSDSSDGWSPRATACTSVSFSPATAPTSPAPPAAARA